jgi:adenosine deaminase
MSIIDFLKPLYPKAQITLHAGEISNGLVPPEVLRFHIRDSVRRGHATRIGHGVDVMQEDDPYGLLREMAARKVLVEIALTSNDLILGVGGARHPLRTYLQHGVPVALATDDYGVSRSSHTLEWVKAVQEHALDYVTIKRMVRNSLEYAFVDQPTKARLKQALENAFHQFEQQEAAQPPRPRR